VIFVYRLRREKLMEDSMIHVIFVKIQIVIYKIAESGEARKIHKLVGLFVTAHS
jgi:hypothetical protein